MNWIRRKPKINTLTESEVLLRHQLLEAIQAEMQKPEDQRDAALIEECLETIESVSYTHLHGFPAAVVSHDAVDLSLLKVPGDAL